MKTEPEFIPSKPWLTNGQYLQLGAYIQSLKLDAVTQEARKAWLNETFNIHSVILSGRENLLDNPRFRRRKLESNPQVPPVRNLGSRPYTVFIDEPHHWAVAECFRPEGYNGEQEWRDHRCACSRDLLSCLAIEESPLGRRLQEGHLHGTRKSTAQWII